MVYALKTQRLTTRKLPKDQFLTCQIHSSSEEKEDYAGCLFSLIQIENNQHTSAQIGHSIINTTAREYFRQNSQDTATNFEAALKKTNELLANYTQEGQTDWIGNIHGIIALVSKKELLFSCVGSPVASLIRNGKLSNIIPDVNDGEIHPLCTFSNITTGPLEKNDIILFASNRLNTLIPKKELRELLELNTLEEASLELAEIITSENDNTNVILIETTTKEDIANEPLTNIPSTIFLDESSESIFKKSHIIIRKKLAPAALDMSKKISHSTKKYIAKSLPWFQQLSIDIYLLIKSKLPNKRKIESESANVKINHYDKLHFNVPKITIIPLVITCLVILLTFSIFFKLKSHTKKIPTKNVNQSIDPKTLSSLQTKFSLAKSAQKTESIALYEEILSQLEDKKLNDQENDLFIKTKQQLTNLTDSIFITKKNSISIPPDCQKTILSENVLYFFTNQGEIYKKSSSDKTYSRITKLPASAGQIISVTGPTSNKTMMVLTSNKKIYEFLPSSLTLKQIESVNEWKNSIGIETFNKNIYLLDANNNQIWKYLPAANKTSYGKSLPYISNNNLIKNPISFSIDGTFYILLKDGKIFNAKKTSVVPVPYTNTPTADYIPKNPTLLKTDSETNHLFVLDNNRIIIFDKTGKYFQTLRTDTPQIKDFIIQPAIRKVWIVEKSSIYSADF